MARDTSSTARNSGARMVQRPNFWWSWPDSPESGEREREAADHRIRDRSKQSGSRSGASLPVHGTARNRQRTDQLQRCLHPQRKPSLGRRSGIEAGPDYAEHRTATIPAGCSSAGRRALEIAKEWANEREQWGGPIGTHEAIASKIAWMASHTLAMEAIVWLTWALPIAVTWTYGWKRRWRSFSIPR